MNIEAAKAVADAIRTSLGPRGMDKMVSERKWHFFFENAHRCHFHLPFFSKKTGLYNTTTITKSLIMFPLNTSRLLKLMVRSSSPMTAPQFSTRCK